MKRAFSPADVPVKADDYHGFCHFERIRITAHAVHVQITFAQFMMFVLASFQGLLVSNRYNRSTPLGRRMGFELTIKADQKTMAVIERLLPETSNETEAPIPQMLPLMIDRREDEQWT